MSVEIRKVQTKKELKEFIHFANDLYKGDEYYAPSLISDDYNTFDPKKNGAFDFCQAQMFLAYKEGKVAGRVMAIINNRANETWKVKQVRYGWIDFINDEEVAKALLDAVAAWGKERGMTDIAGPLGFTDFDPEGMLVEGFERVATIIGIYNYPYYPQILEKLGYTKETDWMEYRITIPDELPERYYKYADIVIAKNKLNVRKVTRRMVNKENYGRKFFKLINETYYKLYGFSLLSDKQIDAYTKLYLGLLDTRMVSFIENENGELVAAGVTMPDLTAALQKCGGKLFPFGWFHLLKAIFWKPCDTLDMLLVGVREDYRGKGLNAVLVTDLYPRLKAMGFKYAETTAELETNDSVQAMWKYFEREQHKRRRVYAKKIE
ncbi:MAG: N-acetyltransferase [Candidatus Cryptobacteroides sp.]|nr:N-acetyltransferase [Bacteroidales bacterium]MDD7133433.1 N-acetyltransferase [Bacteroidales bacterium]MDY2774124.1 N-acetyltransferase [Candidatus Cryptobacteroides sp.]